MEQWVREVELQDSHCVLSYLAQHSRDSKVQRLAIFLRGRCGGSIGTSNIFEIAKNGETPTRKIAVCALRRMRAWAQLADIAATEPSERIRRIAEVREPSPYASRLKTFTKNVAETATESNPQPLYVLPGLEFDQGRKPKTAFIIRKYLERIVERLSSAVWK